METAQLSRKQNPHPFESDTVAETAKQIEGRTGGIIKFKAFNPNQKPAKLMPCEDRTGKLYTGQGAKGYLETLTPQEKLELPFIIDRDTVVMIVDNKQFDLSDPFDAAMWKWIQRHPYIALRKEEKNWRKEAVYYVEDIEAEAKNYVDITANTDIARYKVRQASHTEQIRIAEVLNLPAAKSLSPQQLLTFLLQRADTVEGANAILSVMNPENKERTGAKILFNELVRYRVIEKSSDGIYRFGGPDGNPLGHIDDAVIDFMLNPENVEMVRILRSSLKEATKTGE